MTGRRKSVDLLPPEADEIRAWAITALRSGRYSQLDVLAKLNAELKRLQLKTVSHSAFNRWALEGLEYGFAAPEKPREPKSGCCPTCGRPFGGQMQ